MKNICENCGGPIEIMIRKGSNSCSVDCDRALGLGKYAKQQRGSDE